MQHSFETLCATLQARWDDGPVVPVASAALATPRAGPPPMRFAPTEVWLELVRQRNTWLDGVFYDVGVVKPDEAKRLAPWLAAEGAILLVPPSGPDELLVCDSVDDFIRQGGPAVRAMVVAGVGSSALGSAALARNVADAIGAPVAAVVSGYGLGDIATEALGGFFWFGALNSLRRFFEPWDRLRESGKVADPGASLDRIALPAGWSKDTDAVAALLLHGELRFDLLVGHSKGNLVLSEALYALREIPEAHLEAWGKACTIVTLGAKIAMPSECAHIIDVMGQFDLLGRLNSRPDLGTEVCVPWVGHRTNTEAAFSLHVEDVLRRLHRQGQLQPA